MRRLSSFLFGMIVGGTLVFFGQRYHVVRTLNGFEFVPKLTAGVADTYVDTRGFQAADWEQHQALHAAIVQSKQDNILINASGAAPAQATRTPAPAPKR